MKPYTLSRSERDRAGSPFETELASPKAAPPRSPGVGAAAKGLALSASGPPRPPRAASPAAPCPPRKLRGRSPRAPPASPSPGVRGRLAPRPGHGLPQRAAPAPRPGARGSGGTAGPRPRARGSLALAQPARRRAAAAKVSAGRGAARSAAGGPRAFPESPSVLTALSTAPLRPALQKSATQSGGAACPPQRGKRQRRGHLVRAQGPAKRGQLPGHRAPRFPQSTLRAGHRHPPRSRRTSRVSPPETPDRSVAHVRSAQAAAIVTACFPSKSQKRPSTAPPQSRARPAHPAGPLRPRSAPAPATPAATAVQTAQTGLQTPGRDVSPGPARPRPTPHLPTQMETGAGPDRLPGDATGSFSAVGRPP